MINYIGWVAVVISASSYFATNPISLRIIQAIASVVWIIYGIYFHSTPIIAANIIIAVLSLTSLALLKKSPGS